MFDMISGLFSDSVNKIIIACFMVLLSFVFRVLFRKTVFASLLKYSDKSDKEVLYTALNSISKPVDFLFIVIGVAIAINIIDLPQQYVQIVSSIVRTLFVFIVFWAVFSIIDPLSKMAVSLSSKSDNLLTQTALRLFGKILKFLVFASGLVMILQEWGYNVTGFIASLGLVGMAFALAAKDTAANLFGSIVVFSDKPFVIGDWVKINDNEGIVEDITIRSTMIRRFDQALITMPNSNLTNNSLTNFTRMGKRQIKINLGLTYSTTAEQIRSIVKDIRLYLSSNNEIHQETIHIYFHDFNDSSLGIFCYFFTNTTNWGDYMAVREEVNLEIISIIEANGAKFAFPSQSIYLEKNI